MPWYLGQPGTLVQLPAPSRGTQVPFAALGATHQLLSGGQVLDRFAVKRSWQFSWQALTRDQVGVLDAFVYGAAGPGPHVLLDPEQRNLLPLNVSTGTDTTLDTTGFTATNGGVATSSIVASGNWNTLGGPFPANGKRVLAVTVPNGAAAFALMAQASSLIPVVAGATYTFSAYMNTAVGNGFGVYAGLTPFASDGTTSLGSTGGNVIASGSARSAVTVTAPTTAAYMRCEIRISNANSSGATQTIYADGLQFEQASAVSAWVPGLGVPSVIVAPGGGRTRQQTNWNDYTLTLVEV